MIKTTRGCACTVTGAVVHEQEDYYSGCVDTDGHKESAAMNNEKRRLLRLALRNDFHFADLVLDTTKKHYFNENPVLEGVELVCKEKRRNVHWMLNAQKNHRHPRTRN